MNSGTKRQSALTVLLAGSVLGLFLFPRRHEPRYQGKTSRQWITQLRNGDENEDPRVNRATIALQQMTPSSVPILIRELRHREPVLTLLSAKYGSHLPPMWRRWLPQAGEAPVIRAAAADALGAIGPPAKVAIPFLIKALLDEAELVRANAAVALGRMGPLAGDAVPLLASSLGDSESQVRICAANALGKIGPVGRRAVASLVESLNDPVPLVRASAASALGKINSSSWVVVPELIGVLKDSDEFVRSSAVISIGRFGARAGQATPALASALTDPSYPVRICAAEALGEIGPLSKSVLPALIEAQRNDHAGLGRFVAAALRKIERSEEIVFVDE